MTTGTYLRATVACAGTLSVLLVPVKALVKFNDAKDQIFVTGNVTFGWDSNIFASSGGSGDTVISAGVAMEYTRRAGMIGVNGGLGWDLSKFSEFSDEDFLNPTMSLEFTKDSGRTTGSITLGAARQSRADSAANVRTEAWNYHAGVNVKYPVIERYSLSGSLNYGLTDYSDNKFLVDLASYAASIDLFYVWTSERDLIGGYRFRVSETSANTRNYDHAFTAGVSGRILPKLNGTARVGYQFRNSENILPGLPPDDYEAITASISSTWSMTKKLSLTGQLSKDFSTTSTNISVDNLSATLDAQYAVNAKFAAFAGLGYGTSDFLGPLSNDRRDTYFSWNVGLSYTMNDHLKASVTYAYFHNWSTLAFSDFERHSASLNISSRW